MTVISAEVDDDALSACTRLGRECRCAFSVMLLGRVEVEMGAGGGGGGGSGGGCGGTTSIVSMKNRSFGSDVSAGSEIHNERYNIELGGG